MNEDLIIETERLLLRPYRYEDAKDVAEGLNNINVTKWLAGAPYPYTEEDAKSFIKFSLEKHLYNFAIVLKSENKVIGGTQLTNIDILNKTAGGGIWISEKYWGKGYGTEAFGARIKYAFEELGLRRLENGYFKGNEKSHIMQLRFGYKDEGIRRQKYVSRGSGKIEDECITGLLKEEWIPYDSSSKKPNIFVLHSLNGDTLEMWGSDIEENFSQKNIEVIMPIFPIRAESKYERFDEILSSYLKNKILNENSIVIAHSIGNAYFIRFCMEHNYQPKAYIAVAPGAVYEYPSSRDDYIVEVKKQAYVTKEVLDYMKNMNTIKYCFYSDEEDNNLEKFTRFIEDTHSEGMYLKYYNHFDGYHRIYKIPELNDLINKILVG